MSATDTIFTLTTLFVNQDVDIYIGGVTGTNNITITWGDTTTTTISGTNNATTVTHRYADVGSYTVTCSNLFQFGESTTTTPIGVMANLSGITQFGSGLTNIGFLDAVMLTSVPNSIPTGITNLTGLFRATSTSTRCPINDPNISSWNTSNVTNMRFAFAFTSHFNQSLANWDVSKVTSFNYMFWNAFAFNGNIDNWTIGTPSTNTSVSMQGMFDTTTEFNGNLSNWNANYISNAIDMFRNTKVFTADNYALTLVGWANLKNVPTTFQSVTIKSSNETLSEKSFNGDQSMYNAYVSAYNTLSTEPNAWTFEAPAPILCILKGNQILCFEQEQYVYKKIEDLTTDDMVVTYKHGIRQIKYIYKTDSPNKQNNYNRCVYKMKKTDSMIDDLFLTGGHSIMEDTITQEEYEKNPINNQTIDGKKLIPAFVSSKFTVYDNITEYTCYNLLLENEGDVHKRYGIYCNGVLIETPSEDFLFHAI